MDALILLGSFIALILIGMPVAYALGLSALIGAWWIDIPFQALMIQVAGGVNKFSLMAIPFFVLAGAIMARAACRVGWSRLPGCWSVLCAVACPW